MTIETLKRQLRSGAHAWPGGYPMYFITQDCCALSFDAVRAEFRQVIRAMKHARSNDQWKVIGCEVNWEDASLYCEHTGKQIESAYA